MLNEELKNTALALLEMDKWPLGGARVQCKPSNGDWVEISYPTPPQIKDGGQLLPHRIKPEPKKRLIRPDEMGPIVWFRCEGYDAPNEWRLITRFRESSFCIWTIMYEFQDALPDWQWSPDREEIRSFFVEEEV